MMPSKPITLLFTALALLCAQAWAGDAEIRKAAEAKFPNSKIISVAKTPYSGLYEIFMDGNLFYTDERMSFLLVGNLVDTQSGKNVTQQRLRQLTAIDTRKIPLNSGIRIVKGNGGGGKRTIIVFSDPLCPYCRQLEQTLSTLDNLTVYVMLYPRERMHPGATELAKAIWCAPDRAQAWQAWMLHNKKPTGRAVCQGDPILALDRLGGELGLNTTPTLIFADGGMLLGTVDAAKLDKLLDETPAPR